MFVSAGVREIFPVILFILFFFGPTILKVLTAQKQQQQKDREKTALPKVKTPSPVLPRQSKPVRVPPEETMDMEGLFGPEDEPEEPVLLEEPMMPEPVSVRPSPAPERIGPPRRVIGRPEFKRTIPVPEALPEEPLETPERHIPGKAKKAISRGEGLVFDEDPIINGLIYSFVLKEPRGSEDN